MEYCKQEWLKFRFGDKPESRWFQKGLQSHRKRKGLAQSAKSKVSNIPHMNNSEPQFIYMFSWDAEVRTQPRSRVFLFVRKFYEKAVTRKLCGGSRKWRINLGALRVTAQNMKSHGRPENVFLCYVPCLKRTASTEQLLRALELPTSDRGQGSLQHTTWAMNDFFSLCSQSVIRTFVPFYVEEKKQMSKNFKWITEKQMHLGRRRQ
jgi:hypothetical protein